MFTHTFRPSSNLKILHNEILHSFQDRLSTTALNVGFPNEHVCQDEYGSARKEALCGLNQSQVRLWWDQVTVITLWTGTVVSMHVIIPIQVIPELIWKAVRCCNINIRKRGLPSTDSLVYNDNQFELEIKIVAFLLKNPWPIFAQLRHRTLYMYIIKL